MYESLAKRLAGYEGWALLGLFFGQYLMVVTGPALIVLGLGIWNPYLVLAGLISLRLLFLCCDLQRDVTERMMAAEKANPQPAPPPRRRL